QSQDVHIFNRVANGFNGLVLFALLLAGSLVLLLARRTRWLSRRVWTFAVVAFVFLDLASLGAYLDTGEQDPSANFNHPQAFAWLKDEQPFRIETPEDSWFEWQPNLGLIAHLDDAAGIYNPLLLQRYDRYWKVAIGRDNVLYDLLNAKYLVTKKDAKPSGKFTLAFDGDPTVNIWQNQKALPRAFMVYHSQGVRSGDEAFAAITASGFDPMQTIVLETAEVSSASNVQRAASHVQFTAHTTNGISLEVATDADGYLFVGDTFYPGWRASVDGNDAPVLRADYLFRAVKVPAGNHQVQLVFDPLSWKLGVGLTALGLVGLLLGWLVEKHRR
ncbi:MAG: YfhO family protein, partial [Chloroflexi bacterium]|nr:YfhO family protein [Chloroflexota bacterium]